MREKELVEKLLEKKLHICCAESCTGGMLSSLIVDVPGASDVLDMGFVTYSNQSKADLLGVDMQTVKDHGVVSVEVAEQMAAGAAKRAGADVGVGISGIAGPGGGSPEKPVGTVCFGFCVSGKTHTSKMQFEDKGRRFIRESACAYAINTLIELLK